ncbi:hypothetical protein BFP97_03895 [Roseivirga sp. 4D4]|uniref:ClbS/DfsB family four-helix bundle protein n=1 Tax=Roseivirga sp. 4D4 TaxID=1889784 RepID=UPI00085300B7|nr:ClbS/DfsB family four-helix bundle protein [Roseivirga sp. 4D4]OEK00702.1 hypothetical protein BFP97_03895 [Roseivirga sp. 4D4]
MARPKTKTELLELAEKNYERLINFISDLPEDKLNKEFPTGFLNRNIRDVIAHLYHWHTMVQSWVEVGMAGDKPDIPAKGYTWKTCPELNRSIQAKYSKTPLDEAKDLFSKSHKEMIQTIEAYSNEELFEKKRYKWTGTTSMGSYLTSCTSSHYDWAYKLIKKCLKTSK